MDPAASVLYESQGAVSVVTLNRPDRRNAMNGDLLERLLEVLEQAIDESRVVILTGAGQSFCVGGDLGEGSAGGVARHGSDWRADARRLRMHMRCSELLMDPAAVTIAAINGACAGAGLSLACAADLRYCSLNAVFSSAFLAAGVSGDFGGAWTLTRVVGSAQARELYLRCERLDAERAESIGLVHGAVADDALMEHVLGISSGIAARAPLALPQIKANLNDALGLSRHEYFEVESARHVKTARTADAKEAAAAFMEKRPPKFVGA